MPKVQIRPYLSPTLVLLAVNWEAGGQRPDFLGFAIKRRPGFEGASESWLPNRIGFDGPAPPDHDFPSDKAPIQKFMWWDARIDDRDRGKSFWYTVYPVVATADSLRLENEDAQTLQLVLPQTVENGIGSWFNRAVVSSQSFSRQVSKLGLDPHKSPPPDKELILRSWLANGMQSAIPSFLGRHEKFFSAIYHLTDELWVVPALKNLPKNTCDVVYDSKTSKDPKTKKVLPSPNEEFVKKLKNIRFHGRNKADIMHNKFIVGCESNGSPRAVLCGSANFTTGGLTSQANVLHTLESPGLAQFYKERQAKLATNPTLGEISPGSSWSYTETVGDAAVRVFFSPEKKPERASIDAIVNAVHSARSSVLFCLFTPTDALLRDACFAAGDNGKMMFGLVNRIAEPKPDADPTHADVLAAIELFHRNRTNRDVVGGSDWFRGGTTPAGFIEEIQLFPGEKRPPYPPVIIHHKFVIIDAETDSPTVYTGSANMSGNSLYGNDENLLEIRGSKRIAGIYLAEFMRLYEHYRARAAWSAYVNKEHEGYALATTSEWCRKHFKYGTPEYKSRIAMAR